MQKFNSANVMQTNNEAKVLENIAKWQAVQEPLTPLSETQMDIIYKIEDKINDMFYKSTPVDPTIKPVVIDNLPKYTQWFISVENEMRYESLSEYTSYGSELEDYDKYCEEICKNTDEVIGSLKNLQTKYQHVSLKTNSLHNLSDQLMKDQKILKDKKSLVTEKLQHFLAYNQIQNNFQLCVSEINTDRFIHMLEQIETSMDFFTQNHNLKEGASYRYRFEHLLSQACQHAVRHFTAVVADTTAEASAHAHVHPAHAQAPQQATTAVMMPDLDVAGSFYYGKFQNAANKVRRAVAYMESKVDTNEIYHRTLVECQRVYFSHRSPIITSAVNKALMDLRDKHKTDQGILFRSSGFFVMKVCEDEAHCFYYYFKKSTEQLGEYLSVICEILYDVLRPSLISINHLEVLTELCTSLKEMLNDQVQNNEALRQFVITANQLLHDVEERLVFRANVFFQFDLRSYKPSAGDLAYPEKLEQMENIMEDLGDLSIDSASVVSAESQEVAKINTGYAGQFRSYTGNSAADLHGMWYPTVKRTLVSLSRLYLCLDREIFQGLAQEALMVCVATVDHAAGLIAARRTALDGHLFQIKHLLIMREQIAPFQVDFTVQETGMDWAGVRTAAVGLLHSGDRLFRLAGNNALLEFLLEGTGAMVREYLVDSRKEIDKQLKRTCEGFIVDTTALLVGPLQEWIKQIERVIKDGFSIEKLKEYDFAKPQFIAAIITASQRNIKTKIPTIQKSMKIYLSNRETEFILFRPIKNNILYTFIHIEQLLTKVKYSEEEKTLIACPSAELLNILVSSVSFNSENTVPKAVASTSSSRQST